uniref:Uncharacterized protein n=1 Tax=Rhizophora mucronata TaxID=61149 RepID=A0A2P2PDB3_RHIMU
MSDNYDIIIGYNKHIEINRISSYAYQFQICFS